MQLSSEAYRISGGVSRRPANFFRAILRPTVTIYDQIVLPFEVYYTTVDRGFRQPFNQFGVSPRLFGWLTLHGGYFGTQVSELTFGDSRILGAGVELSPGSFRFAALYGRVQQAVQPDTAKGIRGEYKRRVWAGRIGYDNGRRTSVVFNMMKAKDDLSSIENSHTGLAPKENLVASLSFGFQIGSSFHLAAEAAASAFTNDSRSDTLQDVASGFHWLFTPKTSSQLDGAARASLSMRFSQDFSMSLTSRWVGPGFVTLGYPQAENDVLDLSVAPNLRVLNSKLSLRASLGFQWNNLRENRFATTRRVIGSVNAGYQHTSRLGVDLFYSNYGIRELRQNDTLRVHSISQSGSITPRVIFDGLGGINTLMCSYAVQDFNDANRFNEGRNNYRTQMTLVSWTLSLPSSFTTSTNLNYNKTRTPLVSTKVYDAGITLGYQFIEKTLSGSITLGWALVESTKRDRRLVGGANCSYTPGGAGRFTLTIRSNAYEADSDVVNSSYQDIHGSLRYAYVF